MTRVCDSCMTVAYDKGINGAAEQAATMVSIGIPGWSRNGHPRHDRRMERMDATGARGDG